MGFDTKFETLIAQLLSHTEEGALVWEVRKPPSQIVSATNEVVDLFFTTKFKEKILGIYEEKYQFYMADEDIFRWASSIIFTILDNDDNVLTKRQENQPLLMQLYSSVGDQVSGIDDLLDD